MKPDKLRVSKIQWWDIVLPKGRNWEKEIKPSKADYHQIVRLSRIIFFDLMLRASDPSIFNVGLKLRTFQGQCRNCSVSVHRASSMVPVRTDVVLILVVLFSPPLSILLEFSEFERSVSTC